MISVDADIQAPDQLLHSYPSTRTPDRLSLHLDKVPEGLQQAATLGNEGYGCRFPAEKDQCIACGKLRTGMKEKEVTAARREGGSKVFGEGALESCE